MAIAAYAIRLYVQIRVLKCFEAEDRVLLLSVVSLIVGTALQLVNLGYTFEGLRLSLFGLQGNSIEKNHQRCPDST